MATGKRFSVASGTAPSADESMPTPGVRETPPAPQEPVQPRAERPSLREHKATPPPDEMDDPMLLRQWRRTVGDGFRLVASARQLLETREAHLKRILADAAAVRFPPRLVRSAADETDESIPAQE